MGVNVAVVTIYDQCKDEKTIKDAVRGLASAGYVLCHLEFGNEIIMRFRQKNDSDCSLPTLDEEAITRYAEAGIWIEEKRIDA